MKNTIMTIAVALFMGAMTMNSYAQTQTPKTKAEKADAVEDYKEFKANSEKKIKENEKRIAELREKKIEGTKDVQEKYNKKVADLEQKNTELKNRVSNYKETDDNKWQSFKREFNHDMKQLGNSLKDIGKDNVK